MVYQACKVGYVILFLAISVLNVISEHISSQIYEGWKRPVHHNPGDKEAPYERNKDYFRWAQEAKNAAVGRDQMVSQVLKKASGIYKDKQKVEDLGLEKTVLMTVISYPKQRAYFKHYFRNFLCFAHSYGYKFVVYVTRDRDSTYAEHLDQVNEIGKLGVYALPYPEELFWLFVYGKAKHMHTGRGFASYRGNLPIFGEYGALVMIVPTYEVIKLGYDLIYMDVDLGLVLDPIPHMLLGDADFVSSEESRECLEKFHAYDATCVPWDGVEFNTGIMLIRSSQRSLNFITNWLEGIVDLNIANDQMVLDRSFKRFHNMTYTSNCLPATTLGSITKPSQRLETNAATYCFLSDILFQNGKISLSCTKRQNMLSYTHNMISGGIPISEVKGPVSAPYASPGAVGMYRNSTTGVTPHIQDTYYMAVIHVNFAGGKSDELRKRGLWLYSHHNDSDTDVLDASRPFNPHHEVGDGPGGWATLPKYRPGDNSLSCIFYNISTIHYSHMLNFRETYLQLKQEFDVYWETLSKPGNLVKRLNAREVYLVGQNNEIHLFPNGGTFMKMGYEFDKVQEIASAAFERFHKGAELPDLTGASNTQPAINKVLEEKQRSVRDSHLFYVQFGVFISPNINFDDNRYGRNATRAKNST